MNRYLYPLWHLKASLNERHIRFLELHLDDPFISLTDAAKQMHLSKSQLMREVRKLAKKIDSSTHGTRLTLYYGARWIAPVRVNAIQVGLKKRHQPIFDYLYVNPHHSNRQMSDNIDLAYTAIHSYMNQIHKHYKTMDCSAKTKRLRLYHYLGWYQPYDFWSNDYD